MSLWGFLVGGAFKAAEEGAKKLPGEGAETLAAQASIFGFSAEATGVAAKSASNGESGFAALLAVGVGVTAALALGAVGALAIPATAIAASGDAIYRWCYYKNKGK